MFSHVKFHTNFNRGAEKNVAFANHAQNLQSCLGPQMAPTNFDLIESEQFQIFPNNVNFEALYKDSYLRCRILSS